MIKNLNLYFSNKYDYESDADYGMYNTVTTFGLTKVFSTPDDIYLAVSFGPAINFVHGGDDCDITIDCGENFFASSITSNFSKKLTKRFEIELENEYTASFASTAKYGNEFSSTLTFRPSDESGFNTSFIYLLAPSGEIIAMFRYGTPPEEITTAIRHHMRGNARG